MTESVARTLLPSFFARVAQSCEELVAVHAAGTPTDVHFQRQVLLALAALAACGRREETYDADIALVRNAAADAAAVCRTQAPEESVIRIAEQFDAVVDVCDEALGAGRPPVAGHRFLFPDLDVTVERLPRGWRARTTDGREVEARLLDVALGRLSGLSGHRIAERAVQIMDWLTNAVPRQPR